MSRPTYFRGAILAAGVLAGLAVPSAAFAVNSTAVALTTDNKISTFETSYPTEATAPVAVTGLATDEKLVGIDFRPQNGYLYGLGYKFNSATPASSTIQLYAISARTGVATAIGGTTPLSSGSAPTATTNFGFDFNPTVDRIRVVADSGFNARLNPNNGALVDRIAANPDATPPVTAVPGPDLPIDPTTVKIDGAAYTNNQQNATATTLYTLSGASDKLYLQSPPNDGKQTEVKPVTVGGTAVDFGAVGGFDITPGVNVTTGNAPAPAGSAGFIATNAGGKAALSIVDLNTGAAATVGAIGDGNTPVAGLAVEQETNAGGLPSIALTDAGTKLLRFNTADPLAGVASPTITGINAGETPVAVDYRAQNGQLLLLAVNAGADTGSLYRVDPQTGAATVIGAAGGVAFTKSVANGAGPVDLPTSGYDIDINPTVDRVRVVTDSGLNFRLNPNASEAATPKVPVAVDANPDNATAVPPVVGDPGAQPDGTQTPADSFVGGTAYTNAFGQSLTGGFTTQYGISAATNQLQIQNPPNNGTQTLGKKITVDGKELEITSVKGFDITPEVKVGASNAVATGSGTAVLATTASPNGAIYNVDLSTGVASLKGTFKADPAVVATSLALGDAPPANKTRTTPPVVTPPVVTPPVVTPPVVTPPVVKPPTVPKAAFGSSTRVTLKLRATRVSRKGPAKVTYRNTNKFAVKARFSATTPKSGKRKAIKYSTKSFTLKASKSRTLNVKLPAAAQRVLRAKKKLTIKVTLRVTAPNGKSRNVRKTLTVRLKS